MSDMQGALILLAVAWLISAACCWHAYRNAQNVDAATYDALREPGMGEFGDSPIFDQLCLERLDAELEADR